jgi:hypothetical protein
MTEDVIVYKVGTDGAIKNVRELRDAIKTLKESLNDVNATTEQNAKDAEELRKYQQALRDAMYSTASTADELIASSQKLLEENGNLNGSYNDLVHTMADLKSAWRASTDIIERGNIGKEIERINSKLKDMDASTGNFQRNVGNYTNSIQEAFSATAGGASKAINPIKGVTAGFKALSATPVIAILGLLANVITMIIDRLKSSEENVMAVTEAFSIFGVAGDVTTKIFQALGGAIAKVGEWLTNLLDKMGLVSEAMKERQSIIKEENELVLQERENMKKNADDELRIAELRSKSADKIKYSAQERIKFLEEATAIEAEMSKRAKEYAEREYEVIKRRNALTESSTEDLDKEAQAYANMVKAETDYYSKTRELTAQLTEARNQERAEAEARAKERKRQLEELAKIESDAEKKNLEMRIALAEDGSKEEMELQQQRLQNQYNADVENAKKTIKNEELLQETLLLLEETFQQNILDLQDKWWQIQEKAEQDRIDKEIALAEEKAKRLAEAEHQGYVNRVLEQEEGSKEYLQASISLAKYELDSLHQLQEESDEAFYARRLEAEKNYLDAKKALKDFEKQILQSSVGAVQGIMTSLADIYEQNGKDDEKNARKTKNLRIASSTIDTISGAISAYMGAQKLGFPMGTIVGALQSSAVLASGYANIAKIRATDINSGGGNSGGATAFASAPTIAMDMPVANVVESATDEERLNERIGNQRVYILNSDIEASGKRVEVVNAETSF